MKVKEKTLKCGYKNCRYKNHLIEVDNKTFRNIIYYGGNYYHSKCFKRWCNDCINNSKNGKEKYQERLNHLKDYREEATRRLTPKEESKNKKYGHIKNDKYVATMDDICNFIRDKYSIATIPQKVKNKLNKIFNGSLPEVPNCGIPKEDLLDMWQRKFYKLIEAREKVASRGINMNEEQTILYDITVLVSKYNDYLKWKEQQEIQYNQGAEDSTVITTRNFLRHYKPPKKKAKKYNDDDIINEILGY